MNDQYQVIARKYRPQRFVDVLGQDAIITTLKNAIRRQMLAHAYLFSGSRGTGKTTLARLFAKGLNCLHPTEDCEPCNECSFCKEISSGSSLDVLEIDGASHRGIEDVRQINETVGYATASGKYKIFIIDEVHMLTKEAFNALLKTLEEPPSKVLFFFATTEPHKIPPTVLSRCQRFALNRIPKNTIVEKLQRIARDLKVDVHEDALHMIAHRAEGGLRDAESLLDQVLAFHEGVVTVEAVASILGVLSRDTLFAFDRAGKEGKLTFAFDVAHLVFSQGKDLNHFVDILSEHFRTLILVNTAGPETPLLSLTTTEKDKYIASGKLYTPEQCMTILDMILEAQNQMRTTPWGHIALEALLLRILRTHYRIPVDVLVHRLTELEQRIKGETAPSTTPTTTQAAPPPPPTPEKKSPEPKPAERTAMTPAQQVRYHTLLQFAAVELEGRIQLN